MTRGARLPQVPANRIGFEKAHLSAAQLRGVAELLTLVSFLLFQTYVLGQPPRWNHFVGFGLVFVGVLVVLAGPFQSPICAAKGAASDADAAEAPLLLRKGSAPAVQRDEDSTMSLTELPLSGRLSDVSGRRFTDASPPAPMASLFGAALLENRPGQRRGQVLWAKARGAGLMAGLRAARAPLHGP